MNCGRETSFDIKDLRLMTFDWCGREELLRVWLVGGEIGVSFPLVSALSKSKGAGGIRQRFLLLNFAPHLSNGGTFCILQAG